MSDSLLTRTALAIPASKIVQFGWAAIATGLTTTGWIIVITTPAIAQIVPDQTLGDESSVVTPDQWGEWSGDRIDGGAIRGSALFHSFEAFNIEAGRAAYFTNPEGIGTILNRVTGQNRSDIFGRLGVLGNADLFLLNPNGIVFGPDASLDVAGSFVATTADRFTFADGQFFSAVDPEAPPLLTMNLTAPGLQYGAGRSGSIINAANLTVNPDRNITLTGETVVNTGSVTAPGGEVAIAAITDNTHIQLGDHGQVQEITSLADLHPPTDLTQQPISAPPPQTIPEMVASTETDLGLVITDGGAVAIAATGTPIPTEPGDMIMAGTLN
ncbi:MAG: filamentous hemagglutinin N-terminal domain-containing protein, partial [Leptolyngbyaceae bacterium]|nr:filamentous hemagglutinin N-terminal domain-containing protein [Leptolyngbyaceae bacterium]